MANIRVAAARLTSEQLTLWKEDGSTVIIKQPDIRIRGLLDQIVPICSQGLVAEVNLDGQNTYRDFEEKTGGVIKMFRIAKKFVKHIFSDAPEDKEKEALELQNVAPEPPMTVGNPPDLVPPGITNPNLQAPSSKPSIAPVTTAPTKLTTALDQIMSNAESVSHKDYVPDKTTEEHTIIAVVENTKGEKKIIPGMENLQDQFARAAKLGSTKGVELFLQRLTSVIDRRGHSINDLLRFMERNDLPIADDGCLVAYKALAHQGNQADVFVDCHSRKVIQRVGSHVFMKESMVDPDRRQDCSNGLHIARRAYVGGFRGDVVTIVKVAPESVIAVPQYDSNKMRVCGYHIVAKVPAEQQQLIYGNKPMTAGDDNPAARMLGAVLRGEHVGILEEVEIGGSKGSNLRITPVVKSEREANIARKTHEKAHETAEPAKVIEDKVAFDEVENGKTVAQQVADVKAAPLAGTTAGQARALYDAKQLVQLLEFKKKAKKSWEKLGFSAEEQDIIQRAGNITKVGEMTPTEVTKQEEIVSTIAPIAEAITEKEEPVATTPTLTGTKAEVARTLFQQAVNGDKSRWGTLWRHQKDAKKSWTILGFTDKEIERIKTNKPDHI